MPSPTLEDPPSWTRNRRRGDLGSATGTSLGLRLGCVAGASLDLRPYLRTKKLLACRQTGYDESARELDVVCVVVGRDHGLGLILRQFWNAY